MEHPVVLALLGTSFTFLATVAGAAMVFFVKKEASINTHKAFLGFAAVRDDCCVCLVAFNTSNRYGA